MNSILQRLFNASHAGRLSPSLLFSGSTSIDLKPFAQQMTQHLLCTNRESSLPCLHCRACKNVLDNTHPDVLWIEAEKEEISIEQIREATPWIYRGPFESTKKVAIIVGAELMSTSAANSLLKTLEEPPSHAHLLLLSHTPDSLLTTILSRVLEIRFHAESHALEASHGNLPDWVQDLSALLTTRRPAPSENILLFTERLAKRKEELPIFFEQVQRQLKNDLLEQIQTGASQADISKTEKTFENAVAAERNLWIHYGNVSLVLDSFLHQWLAQ